jgi:hypothetical protein
VGYSLKTTVYCTMGIERKRRNPVLSGDTAGNSLILNQQHRGERKKVEARAGIEPTYAELQSTT